MTHANIPEHESETDRLRRSIPGELLLFPFILAGYRYTFPDSILIHKPFI